MDLKELQENCCCSKCLRCFDEYDHYKWLRSIPHDQPKDDRFRYYCNKQHENVMPNNVRPCFEER